MDMAKQYAEAKLGGMTSASGSVSGPSEPIIPDWMPTDPDELTGELANEYARVGQYYNPNPIKRAYRQSIDTAMGMGGQIADNAMREAIARAGIEGGAINAGMVKAQSMLPVYEHTAQLRTDRATAVTDLRMKQQQAQMQIAQLMAAMRVQHLSSLGSMYITGRGQNVNASLEQQRIDLASNAASSAAERSGMMVGGGGGMTAPGMGSYIPNSGNLIGRNETNTGNYIPNAGGVGTSTDQNTSVVGIGGPGTRMGAPFFTGGMGVRIPGAAYLG